MSGDASKLAGEDSGTAAEGPEPSRQGDAKGGEVKEGTSESVKDVGPGEKAPEPGAGKTDGEVGRPSDPGTPDEVAGLEPGEGPRGDTPTSANVDLGPESEAVTSGAHGTEQGSLAVEGEACIPESLSMKSLSRSITKEDVTCLKSPAVDELEQVGERGRDIGRSQTVPRSFGAQSRRAAAQKLEKQSGLGQTSGGTKSKAHRTTSFGTAGANTVKQRLLEWCRARTRGYEFVDIQNFSTSWSDGMAFCALVHKFFPDAFDYSSLNPQNRRQNFELAFCTAEAEADCYPLIEVDDMVRMGRRPDPKCVFTYVQSLCHQLHKLEPERAAAPKREST
ncbi:smoothelin-like protein 2 [Carcharodon carcharias]|uniref:smoothelin-like protein 2 n=1 Tax=Carcharodon carcharias TaxID=13397 RepID=UPI001B7F1D9C|nr:smoothelin-like protein 2 [Carcharodon carcharias]